MKHAATCHFSCAPDFSVQLDRAAVPLNKAQLARFRIAVHARQQSRGPPTETIVAGFSQDMIDAMVHNIGRTRYYGPAAILRGVVYRYTVFGACCCTHDTLVVAANSHSRQRFTLLAHGLFPPFSRPVHGQQHMNLARSDWPTRHTSHRACWHNSFWT